MNPRCSIREYGNAIADFTNFIFKVYDAFEPLIQFYEDNIEPIVNDVENAIRAADEALFQGFFTRLKDTSDLLVDTAVQAAGKIITDNVDLFAPFAPKVQMGRPENEWYWFDFLHSRRTGQFASAMWRRADNDKDLQRYVLGYVSHIGTDVAGHPFVNAIVGGPYRTHWHRHKLVEGWIDAYARRHYPDSAQIRNCLNLQPPRDKYQADAISGSYYYRLTEFPNSRLPEKLARLFAEVLQDTYGSMAPMHPGMLSAADVDAAYRLWQTWFERSTSIRTIDLPPPPPIPPGAATLNLINDYVNGFPAFPGGPPSGGGFSLSGALAAIFAFVVWLVEATAHTLVWIITNAARILALPIQEAIALANWLLYQVQKGIYEIYDNLRFMLVLGGYLWPEPRDLDKPLWGQAFINTASAHLTGGGIVNPMVPYPAKTDRCDPVRATEHHLDYNSVPSELLGSEGMPDPFYGQLPQVFISPLHSYDPSIDRLYACTGPYGAGDAFTHYVDQQTKNTPQLGSALSFSARLIVQRLGNLPNFNLDCDRGYGWKTWRARRPNIDAISPTDPVEVDYIDP